MEKIQFSIEKYNTGEYDLVNGKGFAHRLLCTDGPDPELPIIATSLSYPYEANSYTKNGSYYVDCKDRYADLYLVPKPPKSHGWIVVFLDYSGFLYTSGTYNTKEMALNDFAGCGHGRKLIACIEVIEGAGLDEQS